MTTIRTATAIAGLVIGLGAAAAQAQTLSFSGGATLTSNYMSRGVTQSMNRAALQFYGEVETSGFYGGIWGSTVDFGPLDNDALEIDLYAGYRFSAGAASFDIGYARYFYDDSGNCCGEIYATVEVESGASTFSAGLNYDPSARFLSNANVGVAYGFGDGFSAALTAGRASDGAIRWNYAVAGMGYDINDNLSVSAEYHVTRFPGQRNQFVVGASVNF